MVMEKKPKLKLDKMHIFLLVSFFIMTGLYWTDDMLDNKPSIDEMIQHGRDLEIMKLYSPVGLKTAINNGDFEYDDLSDDMKNLLDVVELDERSEEE